jgi:NAD(P)H-hydrate epimerase
MTTIDVARIPALTAEEMREVDRIMVEDLHIELVQMMENAGRSLAELAIRRFHPMSVVVLAGRGGNGGGGLVAARHLANRGVDVCITMSGQPDDLTPVTAHQLDIANRMGIPVSDASRRTDLIIDALIGYSLHGDPAGETGELIDWANLSGSPILALDTPSGLDVTSGLPATPCMCAAATLTLALPKVGLLAATEVGELWLADISVPPHLYRRFGLTVPPLFGEDTLRVLGEVRRRPARAAPIVSYGKELRDG